VVGWPLSRPFEASHKHFDAVIFWDAADCSRRCETAVGAVRNEGKAGWLVGWLVDGKFVCYAGGDSNKNGASTP
jgi:hypothetical protein